MNRKKLESLNSMVGPDSMLLVQLPDGTQAERPAAEWWKHRREWAWLGIVTSSDDGILPGMLMMAAVFSDAIDDAEKHGGVFAERFSTEYLKRQANEYLQGFAEV